MARVFLRLKLALMASALRGSLWRKLAFFGGIAFGLQFAIAGFLLLAIAGRSNSVGEHVAGPIFAVILIAWLVGPLMGYGLDETLDPGRLALFPLTRTQLVRGLFVASSVGVAPMMTLVILTGAVVAYGRTPVAFVVAVVAVVLHFALCIVAGRALSTAISRLVRSRRGRDLAAMLATFVGLLFAFGVQAVRLVAENVEASQVRAVGDAIEWTPPAWAGAAAAHAAAGDTGVATLQLAGTAAVVMILGWWWHGSLDRILTTAAAPVTARTRGRRLLSGLSAWLPRSDVGAVAAKELRYLGREPRRRASLFSLGVTVVGIPLFVAFFSPADGPEFVLVAVVPAFLIGLQRINQFGFDGPVLWLVIVTRADLRAEMVGRNLALMVVGLAGTTMIVLVLAAVTGGWIYAVPAIAIAGGVLAVTLGVGNVASVRAPMPFPDSPTNMWAGGSAGTGCATALTQMGSMMIGYVLLVPLAVPAVIGLFVAPVMIFAAVWALLYGYLIWRLGLRLSDDFSRDRLPEILGALEPKRA